MMYYEIQLACGRTTLVDEDIYYKYGHLGWYASDTGSGKLRVSHTSGVGIEKETIRLAHLVFGRKPRPGFVIDHKNRNSLDNRRENLREATRSQNGMNRGPTKGRKYKGITWSRGRWVAQITLNWKHFYLGAFATEIEAAKAYNEAAKRFFGEFVWLNPV